MQRHLAALLLGTSLAVVVPAAAAAAAVDPDAASATLTVTGEATITHAPDLATVAVTIVTNDASATRALSENNRRFANLNGRLTATGIAPTDIVSTSINSSFNPRPPSPQADTQGQLYGFVVNRSVQITVRALATAGSVVDAAAAAGATQIDGVSFGFADPRAVQRAAQTAAMNDALAQAQAIAAAAHMHVVRVLRIGSDGGERQPLFAAPLARRMESSVATTITPSNVDVSAALPVTFVIR